MILVRMMMSTMDRMAMMMVKHGDEGTPQQSRMINSGGCSEGLTESSMIVNAVKTYMVEIPIVMYLLEMEMVIYVVKMLRLI